MRWDSSSIVATAKRFNYYDDRCSMIPATAHEALRAFMHWLRGNSLHHKLLETGLEGAGGARQLSRRERAL